MILHFKQAISCLRLCKLEVNRTPVSFVFGRFKSSSTMDISPVEKVDLSGMRVPYELDETKRDFSVKDPFKLFDVWFAEARNTDGIREANAMAVATADKFDKSQPAPCLPTAQMMTQPYRSKLSCGTGKPSVRYVLLKGYSKEGFTFFTNYNSRKGQEIAENPQVSLLFYWEPLCRQIRIEGSIAKISKKESEEYFHSRPKSSQLSAVVSNQSQVIESKEVLLKKKQELEEKYSGDSAIIPKPDFWGGFCVVPSSFEFWCGRSDRLHDRIRFRKPETGVADKNLTHVGEDGWLYEYLSP